MNRKKISHLQSTRNSLKFAYQEALSKLLFYSKIKTYEGNIAKVEVREICNELPEYEKQMECLFYNLQRTEEEIKKICEVNIHLNLEKHRAELGNLKNEILYNKKIYEEEKTKYTFQEEFGKIEEENKKLKEEIDLLKNEIEKKKIVVAQLDDEVNAIKINEWRNKRESLLYKQRRWSVVEDENIYIDEIYKWYEYLLLFINTLFDFQLANIKNENGNITMMYKIRNVDLTVHIKNDNIVDIKSTEILNKDIKKIVIEYNSITILIKYLLV